MALKESMDILIKDMKIQDARIEADIQTCAVLLGNVEKHTKELKRRQEEKEMFEQLLYRIGGERDFFKDSVQIQTLEDLALEQEREIADNNHLIEEQQAYYDALRKKDYQTLWKQDEDKSVMAAICFAVEQRGDTSAALVRELLGTRNELPEDVARYLLEKVLVYSESKQEADETAEEADILLRDILDRTLHPQSDAVWRNIEVCLNIRKTQRTGARCKKVLNHYQEHKSRFETFEEDYANNCREISAEIKTLENQKIGGEVTSAVKSTKEWFTKQTAELDSLIKRRRSEAALIDDHLQTLQSMYAELENGMESGLQPERCDAICNTLSSMESEAAGVVDTGRLDRERKQLLEDYQTHLKEIRAAKDAEVEREKEHQRIKVRKKTERQEQRQKFIKRLRIPVVIVVIVLVIGQISYLDTGVISGIRAYIPNLCRRDSITIYNTNVPYHISLVPLDSLDLQSSAESLTTLINPFGARKLVINCEIEKVKIHDGTESVRLNCKRLKELTIPDSVISLSLYNLTDEAALKLELPEHLESLTIGTSPDLTDTGFQALKIPESVKCLDIGTVCDNINISGDIEELNIESEGEINVKIGGNVQTFQLKADTVNVTVNGNVQTFKFTADTGNVTVNGNVHELSANAYKPYHREDGTYGFDVAENFILSGNVHKLSSTAENVILNGKIDELYLEYWGDKELILPEGIERLCLEVRSNEIWEEWKGRDISLKSLEIPDGVQYLKIYSDSVENLKIPEGVRWLVISSNSLDLDSLNILEGILYYSLFSKERDELREYQAENCPEELLQDIAWEEFPDLDLSAY